LDEDVSFAIGQGLGKVGLFGDAGDDAPDGVVERFVEPRLLSAGCGKVLEVPPVRFESLFRR
jgi:hypothetical protein